MHHKTRALLVAALIAATALMGTSAAHASRSLSFDQTTFSVSGRLTFNNVVDCTFLLAFTVTANPFPKTATQFGTVNGISTACVGSIRPGAILGPIRMAYRSFGGTLPFIRRINVQLLDFGWSATVAFTQCLWGGAWDGIGIDLVGNRVSGVDFNSATPLVPVRGAPCPTFQTRGQLTTLLTTAPTITLM